MKFSDLVFAIWLDMRERGELPWFELPSDSPICYDLTPLAALVI